MLKGDAAQGHQPRNHLIRLGGSRGIRRGSRGTVWEGSAPSVASWSQASLRPLEPRADH